MPAASNITQVITQAVLAQGNDAEAAHAQQFFKTFAGGYGEGDRFVGVKVPLLRAIAKQHAKEVFLCDVYTLLQSVWHEVRFVGVVLLTMAADKVAKRTQHPEQIDQWQMFWQHTASGAGVSDMLLPLYQATYAQCVYVYLAAKQGINNWDLVDVSTPTVLGPAVCGGADDLLQTLAHSKELWTQRMAMLATLYCIRQGHYAQTLQLAEFFLPHKHDLMHKASGWMLREVGKRDVTLLRNFLHMHAPYMPRTMLRYAIEHLAPQERAVFMQRK